MCMICSTFMNILNGYLKVEAGLGGGGSGHEILFFFFFSFFFKKK